MSNNNASFSTSIKAGRTTYFVDVKETKNGDNYLSISQNRFDGEKKKKTSICVFGEAINQLQQAINDAVASLSQS